MTEKPLSMYQREIARIENGQVETDNLGLIRVDASVMKMILMRCHQYELALEMIRDSQFDCSYESPREPGYGKRCEDTAAKALIND